MPISSGGLGRTLRNVLRSFRQTSPPQPTRRFRNRASRAYDNFDPGRIMPTVAAADDLARQLSGAIARFRQAIDP